MSDVLERFLRYVKVDTQSDPRSTTFPSTAKQFDLAKILAGELNELGLDDVSLDENGYVMAFLPSNLDHDAPQVGFIAHMDTSPDMSGTNVKPRIIKSYDGGALPLNQEAGLVLSPREFPELHQYIGQDLVITDGTTLLGADDKAGIAEIMTALETFVTHPEIKHGAISIGFTPDEEIGHGADRFDIERFHADFAYTMDGGEVGKLHYENFNAAGVKIIIKGRGVHPGAAKNKLINAILVGMELNAMLPVNERPEYTDGYEGFFHLAMFDGSVEETRMGYILRDHDREKFEHKKQVIQQAAALINTRYGEGTAVLEIRDQYFNMRELLEPAMYIVDIARQAMLDLGLQPSIVPIRGGTDGASLSYRGLLTPNIFAGGHNAHGKYEYVPVQSLQKAVDVILKIVDLCALKTKN